jgi:hypothetical protein
MLNLCINENMMNFLVFEFLEEEDKEHQKKIKIFREDITFYLAFVVSSWPYQLEKPILHSSSLKCGSTNFFFINPNPQSFEKVIRFNPNTFNFSSLKVRSLDLKRS